MEHDFESLSERIEAPCGPLTRCSYILFQINEGRKDWDATSRNEVRMHLYKVIKDLNGLKDELFPGDY